MVETTKLAPGTGHEKPAPCRACGADAVTFSESEGYVCRACGAQHWLDVVQPTRDQFRHVHLLLAHLSGGPIDERFGRVDPDACLAVARWLHPRCVL